MHIFGTTAALNPYHADENLKSVLVEGDLEVREESFFGGATDYAKHAADGTLTLYGTARYYDGIELMAKDFKAPASNAATEVNRGMGVAWRFDNNSQESIYTQVRIPGKWVSTEDINIVLIWDSPTLSKGCDWEIRYLFRAIDEDMTETTPDGTIGDGAGEYEISSATANGLVHSTFTIPADAFGSTDKKLLIQVYRDADAGNGDDTLENNAYLHAMMVRGTANKLGGDIA